MILRSTRHDTGISNMLFANENYNETTNYDT